MFDSTSLHRRRHCDSGLDPRAGQPGRRHVIGLGEVGLRAVYGSSLYNDKQ